MKNLNTESKEVRNGLTQIKDWQCWVESNKNYFFRSCGVSELANSIPSWMIQYCLVVSRRKNMDEDANLLRSTIIHNYCGLKIIYLEEMLNGIKRNAFQSPFPA